MIIDLHKNRMKNKEKEDKIEFVEQSQEDSILSSNGRY